MINGIYCRHPKTTMNTRQRKNKIYNDLELYEKRLKKCKKMNRKLRRSLLAIAKLEVENKLYSSQELKDLQPLTASRTKKPNGDKVTLGLKKSKGLINRKCYKSA